ncbi:hypothetical protein C0J52_07644 [Blattella germanica]|nr:hypothetical protein C0J52_07644 [Blattella germanica]
MAWQPALAVLIMCLISYNNAVEDMQCPDGICTCKTQNETQFLSNCTNASLTNIPKGLDSRTTVLNVSNNNISKLSNGSSEKQGILHIDKVYYNVDHKVDSQFGVLRNFNSLTELHLESNVLASIEPGALNGTPNIIKLNLRNNNLTSLPVDVITLKNHIRELDIAGNGISNIDLSIVKKYYPAIRRLDVSRNKITHFISTSPIDNSTLEVYDASLRYVVRLNKTVANTTKLQEVNASSNEITDIDANVFSDSPDLVGVDISRNRILTIHKDAFSYNSKLTDVNVGSNRMTFIHPDTFSKNPHLTRLTVSWNDIQEIHPETFVNNPNLESIDFNTNKIKTLNPDVFQNNPHLRSIDLRSNSLLTVQGNTFHNNPQLEHLLLSKNEHIRFHNGFLLHATTLKVFDADHCNLTQLPAGLLGNSTGLQELNLANNELTSLDNITNYDGYSNTLTKLEVLDLSNNRLQRINVEVFSNKLTNLKQLRIAGNSFLCDCNLRSLWLWSQNQGIIPSEPQITCTAEQKTVPWDEVQYLNCTDEDLLRQMGVSSTEGGYENNNNNKNNNNQNVDENTEVGDHFEKVTECPDKNEPGHNHHDKDFITNKNKDNKSTSTGNKILVGVSLFILLAVCLVILPLLFLMRKRYGTYKVTKPKNLNNVNGGTNADPLSPGSPSV